ncbi:MAG TPA: exosortase/archaeosortase family protein [Candidatus Limnocylindria bacterium]|nr:exosortase/archaeosortase family protein [Candidatus Limnocylindria bacterium]
MSEATANDSRPSPPRSVDLGELTLWIPGAAVLAWWIYDLSFQWASLVEFRFGWMVVMLSAFLFWERWPTRPKEDVPASTPIVVGLALAGLPLIVMAELYKWGIARVATSSMLLSLGSTLLITANIVGARGWKTWRHFAFLLLFFYVAVPIPRIVWQPIVMGLQTFVATVNVIVLNLSGIPAERFGHVINLPNCQVGVNEACSGIRSLQSSLMAALFVGDLTLRKAGWKVFFLFAGVCLAVIGNLARALFLAVTAYRHGADALKEVHDTAGWSVLAFTFVGVAVLAWIVTRMEKRYTQAMLAAETEDPEPKSGTPTRHE